MKLPIHISVIKMQQRIRSDVSKKYIIYQKGRYNQILY